MKFRFVYPVLSYEVYDGDTINVERDKGEKVFDRRSCRLLTVDTPEIRPRHSRLNHVEEKQAGLLVTECVGLWLRQRADRQLMTVSISLDKYGGRYNGDIFPLDDEEETLGKWLLDNKLGRAYSGGARKYWPMPDLKEIATSATRILLNDAEQPLH